jgi:hypothetical protein
VAKEKVPNNFLNSISLAEKTNSKTLISGRPSRFFDTINMVKVNNRKIINSFKWYLK